MRWRWNSNGRNGYRKRPPQALTLTLILVSLGALSACHHGSASPGADFANANRAFVQGNLEQSQQEAERGYRRFRVASPDWARKFRVLEARVAVWRGMYPDALRMLEPDGPSSNQPDTLIAEYSLRGVANAYIHNFQDAESLLSQGAALCELQFAASCGELLQSRGLLASQRKESASAAKFYEQSLQFARSHQDTFLESSALLNLGAESLSQDHFDEAIDFSESARHVAATEGARVVELAAQANIGWARYRLGDSEGALVLLLDAEKLAVELGDVSDQENELTNLGYIYMDERKPDEAKQSFLHALDLARKINSKEDVYNALRVLARLSLQMGDSQKASEFAEQALSLAHEISNRGDEFYPRLVLGQIAAAQADTTTAESTFRETENDRSCPVFLKWEAQHSLAQLYEERQLPDQADRQYRAALTTFELARSTVRREDFQISFLTNGARLYDDYVHFLITRHQGAAALKWADFSRARTLAEGLGVAVAKPRQSSTNSDIVPPELNAQSVARRVNGLILFYWLGEKQSYLWAATAKKTRLFELPPRLDVEAALQRYRAALMGPQDVLDSNNEDGLYLYRILIAPASDLLRADAKVFVVPDGSLNNLNFETLIVPSAKPHYWIEDADVVNVSSLRILAAAPVVESKRQRKLLLIGDSVSVGKDYPELPKAADQMASVSRHFPPAQQRVFQREQATPSAFLKNDPEQFSTIHFVAHGTASRLSPLDSAIVLSKDTDNPNSFKLYARDIIHHHLRADLVTISACYGAGERQYSGEGLVGLAWAFLRAGSRNVIAALWDAADASTDQLMDRFYDELAKGSPPDAALRAAKLSLLKGTTFRSPFYWAPFQLFVG